MGSTHWTQRLLDACDTLVWILKLNLWWLLFTLLGLVVVGIAPASAAAAIAVRRRTEGERFGIADFARTYRSELLRSQPVLLPVFVVLVLLALNSQWFSLMGPSAAAPRLATLGCLVAVIGPAAYVGPLYAYYQMPRRRYPVQAVRLALARPLWTLVLIFVAGALIFLSARFPVLVVVISIGAWLQTSTRLCLRFFAENEDRRAQAAPTDSTPHGPRREDTSTLR